MKSTDRFTLRIKNSGHAEERIWERINVSPAEVLEIVNSGRGIVLSNPLKQKNRRGYILIYAKSAKAHFVVVFAVDADGHGTIVTVLTQEQYEHDIGHRIDKGIRKRAARSVCSIDEYLEWNSTQILLHPEEMSNAERNKTSPRLRITYKTPQEETRTAILPPLPSTPEEWSVSALFAMPEFPSFLETELSKRKIAVDQIVSMTRLMPGDNIEPITLK